MSVVIIVVANFTAVATGGGGGWETGTSCRRRRLSSLILLLLVQLATATTVAEKQTITTSKTLTGDNDIDHPNQHYHYYDRKRRRNLIIDGTIVEDPSTTASFVVRSHIDDDNTTTDYVCGGAIIHDDIVVTAAHCYGAFYNGGVIVWHGSSQSFNRTISIDQQVWPYEFDPSGITGVNNDIMLLRLSESVFDNDNNNNNNLNNVASVIQPLTINTNDVIPTSTQPLTMYGFGRTEDRLLSDQVREGTFTAISNNLCSARLEPYVNAPTIYDDMICVDPITTSSICGGDSGGPLVEKTTGSSPVLVGIASFSAECRADTIPDGYARVSSHSQWIIEQICRLSRMPPSTSSSTYNCNVPSQSVNPAHHLSQLVTIQIVFKYDDYPEQTQFRIVHHHENNDNEDNDNLPKNVVVFAGPNYIPSRSSTWISTIQLLPGNYTMEVYDKRGDGLMGTMMDRQSTEDDGTSTSSNSVTPSRVGGWKIIALYNDDNQQTHEQHDLDHTYHTSHDVEMSSATSTIVEEENDSTILAVGDPNFQSIQMQTFVVEDRSMERCMEQKLAVQNQFVMIPSEQEQVSCDCEIPTSSDDTTGISGQLVALVCRNTLDNSICSIVDQPCGSDNQSIPCCGNNVCIDGICRQLMGLAKSNTDNNNDQDGNKEKNRMGLLEEDTMGPLRGRLGGGRR